MAKHKAPTAVTIAPLAEKSLLEQWVSKYWMPALGAFLAVTIGILWTHYQGQAEKLVRDGSWNRLMSETTPTGVPRVPSAPAPVLAGLSNDLAGTAAGPWARLLEVTTRIQDRDYEGAAEAAETLRREYPEHELVAVLHDFGDGEPPRSIVDNLIRSIEAQKNWEAQHPELFGNPPVPEGAPRVRLQTSAGDIVVGLYPDKAPAHVENFLKLCGEGYYDGTKIHRIVPGFMIQGGDPNSRDGEPSTWGQGGPDEKLDPERNDLFHFAGVLSAAKNPGESQSSGSQFFITTDPAHHLDGRHVVYGAVLEGMDLVQEISRGAIAEGTPDRPADPVTIEATEIP